MFFHKEKLKTDSLSLIFFFFLGLFSPSLLTLYLFFHSELKLDQIAMKNLLNVVSGRPEISILNLTGCSFTSKAIDIFFDFLQSSSLLVGLVLRNTVLSESALRRILASLPLHQNLYSVSLSGVGAEPSSSVQFYDLIPVISEWLPSATNIRTLDLSGLKQAPKSLSPLASALLAHSRVTHLDLSHNRLDESHVSELLPYLSKDPPLRSLSLSFNEIGDEGARMLADACSSSSHLKSLYLCSTGIVEKHGSKDLARLIARSDSITHLDLSDNRIRKSGAKAILTSLTTSNKKLRTLDLHWSLVPIDLENEIAQVLRKRISSPPS